MIFDSNILIYLSKYILKPENLINNQSSISIVTKIEALGYSFQSQNEYDIFSDFCSVLTIVSLSDDIADETIRIRKEFKIKLPDAIIYSTALICGLPLLTNNINDFKSLDGKVELINPFDL